MRNRCSKSQWLRRRCPGNRWPRNRKNGKNQKQRWPSGRFLTSPRPGNQRATRLARQRLLPIRSRPWPRPGHRLERACAAGRPVRRAAPVLRVAAVILIALVAGAAAFTVSRLHVGHHSPSRRGTGHARPASAAQLAADWVAQQVSRNVTVACDPLMCAALEARGLPTAKLLVLRADAANPLGAGVVVVTPAVRSQFGRRLDSEYAPLVIAGFGSGPGQVDVQVVAPDGAAAYLAALHQDLTARKSAGTQLLANKQIGATARARAQLEAGSVDSRLLIVLPTLAATHPIQVLAFGDSGPGAGPDTPLCVAELSGSGRAAGMADAAYQRWLTSFIGAQLNHFTGSVSVIRVDGQPVVRLEFARPSPLGLLTG